MRKNNVSCMTQLCPGSNVRAVVQWEARTLVVNGTWLAIRLNKPLLLNNPRRIIVSSPRISNESYLPRLKWMDAKILLVEDQCTQSRSLVLSIKGSGVIGKLCGSYPIKSTIILSDRTVYGTCSRYILLHSKLNSS